MASKGRQYHHGDLREALIDAALRTLETDSLTAVSMRRLARDSGVSHAAPYHHFPDLDALLAAVAARGFRLLREEMEREAVVPRSDAFRQLQAAGTTYVSFAVSRPELFRLMFSGRWREVGDYPELEEAERLAFGSLQQMIAGATGKPAGTGSTRTAARAAWALVHGTAVLLIDGRIDLPPDMTALEASEHLTRELTAVLGKGLRSLKE